MLIRQILRTLLKAPGFATMAIITLALGIGATTALFSVVDSVLLQPLALPQADRVVAIKTVWPDTGRSTQRISGGDFVDLRSMVRSLGAVASYGGGEVGVGLPDRTRFAYTVFADPGFFRVLQLQPALGRWPDALAATQDALVTTRFARENFGDAGRALGKIIAVDNKAYAIAGLIDPAFAFPEKAEVWITTPLTPENLNRTAFNYRAIARLRDGVSQLQLNAELATLGMRLASANPESDAGKSFVATSLQEQLTAPVRTTLWFLFGAASLLLLISCANVTNLMLARATSRTREVAIRLSLGSSEGRIFQLLLTEGVLLGIVAAILGLAIAYAALHVIYPLIPATVPNAAGILHVRLAVLLFASAVSLFTVAVCSLVPALHLRKTQLADVLKQTATRGLVGGATRSRHLIIVGQIALCCTLCVAAVLLSRTLIALVETPLGFRSEGVLVMYAHAPANGLPQQLQSIRTFETALEDIRKMHGVIRAAAAMGLPTGSYGSNGSYMVEGVHVQAGQDPFKHFTRGLPEATFALASAQYFKTMGIHLLAGRDFNQRDQYDAPFTAIISQSLARRSFGSSDPLGHRLYCGLDSPKPMTIVGVVSDVRQDSPASKPEPEIYMPFQQHPFYANELQVTVRAEGDPLRLVPEVRNSMQKLAPFMATKFTTFTEMVQDSIAAPRFRAELSLTFAITAILLAITGVYGIMSYYVSERSLELGLRMALGATRTSIIALVAVRALWLAAIGLTIGIASAVALSRVAENLLYGVQRLDLPTYVIAAGVVLCVVIMAAFIPSWRASRLDAASALRTS